MTDEEHYVSDPEEAVEVGYYGIKVDPTPDENYTVKGGPTPETDDDMYEKAQQRLRDLGGGKTRR